MPSSVQGDFFNVNLQQICPIIFKTYKLVSKIELEVTFYIKKKIIALKLPYISLYFSFAERYRILNPYHTTH